MYYYDVTCRLVALKFKVSDQIRFRGEKLEREILMILEEVRAVIAQSV
jgi:hypothetical protein